MLISSFVYMIYIHVDIILNSDNSAHVQCILSYPNPSGQPVKYFVRISELILFSMVK